MLLLSLSVLLPLLPLARSSFYDNPELEIPAESGTPLDELKAKWDFDVSVCPPSDGIYRREIREFGEWAASTSIPAERVYSGDSQAYQPLHTSDT
jgi:hypothetical protein